MSEIIIFGGTTEGRLLAEYCHEHQIPARVCVTSEYGADLLPESSWLKVEARALSREEIGSLLQTEKADLVVDATHPYAALVSGYVKQACQEAGVSYLRIARGSGRESLEQSDFVVWVRDTKEAVDYLSQTKGAVFLTTGSKELECYTKIPEYEKRLFVRVLPDAGVIQSCQEKGICGKHLIAMQGPFSLEMNLAMMQHTKADYLVTKEAGAAGGFLEKAEAARKAGVTLLVIGRPEKPEGVPLADAIGQLETFAAEKGCDVDYGLENNTEGVMEDQERKLYLAGIGMGGSGQMTLEVQKAIRESEVLFGAPRMLKSLGALADGKKLERIYAGNEIASWLETHPEHHQAVVVYSGDTGFYSGARQLLKIMAEHPQWKISVLPGISTVSYLCSKLKRSWESVYMASAHGRECKISELLKQHREVFLLLGGENPVQNICLELLEQGMEDCWLAVGEYLSYPEERIVTGSAKELFMQSFDPLCAMLIVRQEKECL